MDECLGYAFASGVIIMGSLLQLAACCLIYA